MTSVYVCVRVGTLWLVAAFVASLYAFGCLFIELCVCVPSDEEKTI